MGDPLWVPDISHHQGDIDLRALAEQGAAALIARVGQGAGRRRDGHEYGTTRDRKWMRNRDGWRAIGRPLVAYWYIGNRISADENARLAAEWVGDRSIPWMLDHENASGSIAFYHEVRAAFERRGLRVVLGYVPRWYWDAMGRAALVPGPPLVNSRYVSASGTPAQIYPGDDAPGWADYGGGTVALLQFSSRALMAGQLIDCSAYRGTPAQLAALLGGGQEDDMPTAQEVVDELLARVVPFHADPANVGGPLWMHISGANWSAQRSEQILTEQRAVLAALLASQQDDVTDVDVLARLEEAMAAEIDRLRAELVAARDADRAAMVAAVRDTVPAELADQVVTRLGERLAPVAPAPGGGA